MQKPKIIGLFRESCFHAPVFGFVALWMASACSGVQYQIPEVDQAEEKAALEEIEAVTKPAASSVLSEVEAERLLRDVYAAIKPSAVEVCRFVEESSACAWVVSYNDMRVYNAVAMPGNRVMVFHDIISASESEDEVAYVLAHEIGHHIADHIRETRRNQNTGAMIAGLALAAATHGTVGCQTSACLNNMQSASQAVMQLGEHFGGLIFSVEQEKEADYLAAYIISLAGYDLAKSRNMLVQFGAKSDRETTGFLNSHPAPPERLASFDKTVQEILHDGDGLPGKDPIKQADEPGSNRSPADGSTTDDKDSEAEEFDPAKCRIYLPEDGVCIY
jgi:Zn-dependent protease with chaperone function